MALTTPAPIRGSYRFGDIPFSQEAADRMARRVHVMVDADPDRRNPEFWARRIGLSDDAERTQVLERYRTLEEWGW